MSEIKQFQKELKLHGPLQPGEQSLLDLYLEFDEVALLPDMPGVDPAKVPASLDYQFRAAAEEYAEHLQEQAEKQAELNFEYQRGRAQAQGMKDAHDPGLDLAAWKRDLPEGDRRTVQRIDELRQKIQNQAAQADLKRAQAERSGSGYVYDKLMEEAQRLEFSARLDHEELERIEEDGIETLREQDYAAARQSAKEVLNVFKVENCPLSHLDEKISEANKSNLNFGYARRGDDKLFKISHEGDTIGNVFKQLREDERLSDVGDHELLLVADEMGMGYNLQVERVNPDAPSRRREPEETEVGGDIEVVSASEGGFETTEHDYEEKEPEVDRGPKPKTALAARL